jgi:hypothetical protein
MKTFSRFIVTIELDTSELTTSDEVWKLVEAGLQKMPVTSSVRTTLYVQCCNPVEPTPFRQPKPTGVEEVGVNARGGKA